MPNICFFIKQEYEALKNQTQEFVSACAKAGDPRSLSADQLRTLQIQKQELETVRDRVRNTLEPRETRMWKGLWKKLTTTTIHTGSEYDGMTILDIIHSNNFQDDLDSDMRDMLSGSEVRHILDAVIVRASIFDLGIVSRERQGVYQNDIKLRTQIKDAIQRRVKNGISSGVAGWHGIVLLNEASRLGLFTSEEVEKIRKEKMQTKEFLDQLRPQLLEVNVPFSRFETGLFAAIALRLFSENELQELHKTVELPDVQEHIIRQIMMTLTRPQDFQDRIKALQGLHAIKQLIPLSRRLARPSIA